MQGTFVLVTKRKKEMATKPTIAIIGSTGRMGTAIAKSLAKGNHRLLLFGRSAEEAARLGADIATAYPQSETEGIDCQVDACWEADIVILTVPHAAEAAVAERIKPYVTKKIVISIANPMNETMDGMAIPPDTSAAEELQRLLPDAHVVKAFNTTFAADFAEPVIAGQQVDAFVAGDNEQAVKTVSELVASAGFRPVIAGKLAVSRTLEHMQLLLIRLNIENGYNWHAGWKILHDEQVNQ